MTLDFTLLLFIWVELLFRGLLMLRSIQTFLLWPYNAHSDEICDHLRNLNELYWKDYYFFVEHFTVIRGPETQINGFMLGVVLVSGVLNGNFCVWIHAPDSKTPVDYLTFIASWLTFRKKSVFKFQVPVW